MHRKNHVRRLPVVAGLFLAAQAVALPASAQTPAPLPIYPLPTPTDRGLDVSAMDTSVKPCEDFFRYANGKWLDSAVIPADKSGNGAGSEVRERGQILLREIAEQAAGDQTASLESAVGKVGSFYRSGMDEAQIEKDGVKPLMPEFARIDAIHDIPGLLQEFGHLH